MKKLIPFVVLFLVSFSTIAEETRAVETNSRGWVRGCTGNITDCYFSVLPGSNVYSRFTVADAPPTTASGGHRITDTDIDSRKAPFSGYHWIRSSRENRWVYITE